VLRRQSGDGDRRLVAAGAAGLVLFVAGVARRKMRLASERSD
jgi:hypothetical protein